jgi:hypothetical protein
MAKIPFRDNVRGLLVGLLGCNYQNVLRHLGKKTKKENSTNKNKNIKSLRKSMDKIVSMFVFMPKGLLDPSL